MSVLQTITRETSTGETKELPQKIVNIYHPENSKFFYQGEFDTIQFGLSGEIRLNASIEKIEEKERLKRKSIFNQEKILEKYQERIWKFDTNYQHCCVWQRTIDENSDEFYKKRLIENAFDKKIKLNNEILNNVFNPLEKRINEFLN
ncbi:MAG: hypothetical protein KJ566_02965 [Nanoarchaeota archaeon]|nr:hypothetical protein [Nanoarchaeota archaeon]